MVTVVVEYFLISVTLATILKFLVVICGASVGMYGVMSSKLANAGLSSKRQNKKVFSVVKFLRALR